eukprot:jgi/Bigna1/86019/estExt_fgenesh1_pg.C_70273
MHQYHIINARSHSQNKQYLSGLLIAMGAIFSIAVLVMTSNRLGAGVGRSVVSHASTPTYLFPSMTSRIGCQNQYSSRTISRLQRQVPRWQIRAEEEVSEGAVAPLENSVEEASSALALDQLVVGDVYKGRVKGVVNFGAFVDIGAEKDGLLHVSDLGEAGYIPDASKFVSVGDEIEVKIKSVDATSQKLSLEANKAARTTLSELPVGQTIEGKIRNVASFGAFVDIGAEKDGLLHISQMEGFVENINDVLKEGDSVTVRISGVDTENGKITLSQREEGSSSARKPRQKQDITKYADMKFEDKIKGEVVGIEPYGAFIQLEDGVRGLLPISYMAEGRIDRVESVMSMGQTIECAVLQANVRDGKLSLTLVDPATVAEKPKRDDQGGRPGGRGQVLTSSKFSKLTATLAPYDEAPFMTQIGGAFAAAGIVMSDNAKAVLRERVNTEFGANFQERDELEKALAAKEKEEAMAAVAAAAEAEAAEAEATDVADENEAAAAEEPVAA